MNAHFGIFLRKSDSKLQLAPIPPRVRTWGGEVVRTDEPVLYSAAKLDGVQIALGPLTKFVRNLLPAQELSEDLEYAQILGPAVNAYEHWLWENNGAGPPSAFEAGLLDLLNRLKFWGLLFVPDDRLEAFVSLSADEAVQMLRREVHHLSESQGFLALRA